MCKPRFLPLAVLATGLFAAPPGWRAGAARVEITPAKPLWLAGFASRTHPSEGTLAPIHAKALAL